MGNPRRFILIPGQQSDHKQAQALLADDQPAAVIGDKGYESKRLANKIEHIGAEVVIPSRVNAKELRSIDENL